MIARMLCGLGATMLLSSSAAAQVVDDFEHGNEALYSQATSGDNMSLTAGAAHASNFGAQFIPGTSGFRLRTDVTTAPGNTYDWFVRLGGLTNNNGRSYVGFGASAGGALSGVFGPNTGQILIQNNTSWSFLTLGTAAFVPVENTWYRMRMVWDLNGDMTLSILDEAGTTTFATVGPVATSFTSPGGLALRGFTTSTSSTQDVDTVEAAGGGGGPIIYCTAKTTSSGCVPAIASSGVPSAAGNFIVSCSQVESAQLGVLFYGLNGPAAVTFQGGFLCVAPPVTRLPLQNSGGAGACAGTYSQSMTALISTLSAGQVVNCQYWFRDPGAASGTGLSDAIEFIVQ